jgi:hypothetical protein
MNEQRHSRVVVWLDPNAPQEASLQALAALGAASEVLGLFVEDMDLLELSRLSVAREITYEGSTARQLEQDRTEQLFRLHGTRMRNLFEAAARKLSARHSFRVARGILRTELLKAAAEYDTLVLAHSRRQFGARLTIRTQLGELLTSGPRTLVIVQERWQTGQHVAVLYDASPASEIALRTAAAIARSAGVGLSVWLPEERGSELQAQATEVLGGAPDYSFRAVADSDDALIRAANSDHASVLVLPATDPAATRERVTTLLDRANCSVIVTR